MRGARPPRIALAMLSHESNTFIEQPTDLATLRASMWLHGEEILAVHAGTETELGGMLAAAKRLGVEAVPAFAATAEPGGVVTAEAYGAAVAALTGALEAAGPLDGLCIALHGAGVVEGVDDLEGDLLARLRALLGDELPLIGTLDLHTNLSAAMVRHATALVPCLRYPHVDLGACGERAVELAVGCARGELRPVTAVRRLPMLLPPTTTDAGAGRELLAEVERQRARPDVLHCGLLHGFPYTDTPDVGAAAIATTDGRGALAEEVAQGLAEALWNGRAELLVERPGAEEAVAATARATARPVVVAEISDNPGGGAPGDGTRLLRAMLDAGLRNACFGFLCDRQVAAQAHAAGVGARIRVRLGARSGPADGEPIDAEVEVVALTDGRFDTLSPMDRGRPVDLGPCALLRFGGVEAIVASERAQTFDEAVFALHGVDVRALDVVALKSSAHYRAGFAAIAGTIVEADTGGATTVDPRALPYARIGRPIWPLDEVGEADAATLLNRRGGAPAR